jgi:hypothetical protein
MYFFYLTSFSSLFLRVFISAGFFVTKVTIKACIVWVGEYSTAKCYSARSYKHGNEYLSRVKMENSDLEWLQSSLERVLHIVCYIVCIFT